MISRILRVINYHIESKVLIMSFQSVIKLQNNGFSKSYVIYSKLMITSANSTKDDDSQNMWPDDTWFMHQIPSSTMYRVYVVNVNSKLSYVLYLTQKIQNTEVKLKSMNFTFRSFRKMCIWFWQPHRKLRKYANLFAKLASILAANMWTL